MILFVLKVFWFIKGIYIKKYIGLQVGPGKEDQLRSLLKKRGMGGCWTFPWFKRIWTLKAKIGQPQFTNFMKKNTGNVWNHHSGNKNPEKIVWLKKRQTFSLKKHSILLTLWWEINTFPPEVGYVLGHSMLFFFKPCMLANTFSADFYLL